MAVIYRAEIHPTKLELIASWLPTQTWFGSRGVDELALLGAYRFDDPAGEVGIETLLVDAAGTDADSSAVVSTERCRGNGRNMGPGGSTRQFVRSAR